MKTKMPNQWRRPEWQVYLTVVGFIVIGVVAVVGVSYSYNSYDKAKVAAEAADRAAQACAYQKSTYPDSKKFRLAVKSFMSEEARRLGEEAQLFRKSAVFQTDPEVKRGALQIAASKERNERRALTLIDKVLVPPPPTCTAG